MNFKTLTVTTALAASALSLGYADAQEKSFKDGLYLTGSLGLSNASDADYEDATSTGEFGLDSGTAFTFGIGKRFTDAFRAELEFGYREADIGSVTIDGVGTTNAVSGEIETTTYMANAYYDFMPEKRFSPYITAGLGVAQHDGSLTGVATISGDDTVFAYQVGFGGSFDLKENTAIFADYRYLGSTDPDYEGDVDSEYDAQEIRVGLRYSF